MPKKIIVSDVTEDSCYHDTWQLMKKYRDVVWSLELSVQQVRNKFQIEFGKSVEDFLESIYLAGADLSGTDIEDHARCIQRSAQMIKLVDSAMELLHTRHKDGEAYYWLLYYTYMTPQQPHNAYETIAKEYDVTVQEMRATLQDHFGLIPCPGI